MMFDVINIIITAALFMFLMFLLFPIEKVLSKPLKTEIFKTHVFLALLLIILLVLAKTATLGFLISFPLIVFSFPVFLFGILSNRKYIYILALISLALTPVMLILKIDKLAESLAQTCYLLLVLGVLKDIFYEKIFE